MHSIVKALHSEFIAVANGDQANAMAAYMKNQFSFYGIKSRERRQIVQSVWKDKKELIKKDWVDISGDAWAVDQREMQYAALDIISKIESQVQECDLIHIEGLIEKKSWWDTVDFLASHAIGQILREDAKFRVKKAQEYAQHPNIWFRRTAIIFQLGYKENTDENLLFDIIEHSLGTKEFFINKAIGWALRQYSKSNPDSVQRFIDKNRNDMASLSIREAVKYLKH